MLQEGVFTLPEAACYVIFCLSIWLAGKRLESRFLAVREVIIGQKNKAQSNFFMKKFGDGTKNIFYS